LRSRLRCTAVSERRGQNHAVRAIAIGMLPQTTAHGVKTEPMKSPVTATALTKGQIVGSGKFTRRSGLSTTVGNSTAQVDRYLVTPGQAAAYKLGEIQIRRHRREAEEKLGAKFDQRRFHDAILAIGSVPLPVLEERMKQFIADGGVNPPATTTQQQ